jgi:TldD protein
MQWDLGKYNLNGKHYTELRAQENRSFNLSMLNGEITKNLNSKEKGISARTLINGSWGFASHPEIQSQSLENVLMKSEKNAMDLSRFRKDNGKIHFSKMKGSMGNIDYSSKNKISEKEVVDYLKKCNDLFLRKFPNVINRTINVRGQNFIKEIINSENAHTVEHFCRTYFYISFAIDGKNGPVEITEALGGIGEIEQNLMDDEFLLLKMNEAYGHLMNKSSGIHAEAGEKEVVLGPRLAGILAHEAVGHTVEADIVKGGSVAFDNLNQRVASSLISMTDFAHTAYGKKCPSPVYFDDEGTEAQDTVLIKDGILKSFMHNKESAAEFEVIPTGHARAWAFNDEPLIRMRNTAVLAGNSKLDEMISSVKDGYYLIKPSNGQADTSGEFMFGVSLGYEIKNGKLGRAILDTTISGVAFEMLKTVSMVSDDMEWLGAGHCGKKQLMHVGMGGPAIKCKINIGGV